MTSAILLVNTDDVSGTRSRSFKLGDPEKLGFFRQVEQDFSLILVKICSLLNNFSKLHSLRHSLLRKIIKKYFKNEEEPCLICLKSIAVQNPTHKNRFLGIWSLCNTYILHLYLVRYIFKKLYLCIIWHLLTQLIKIFKTGFFEGSRHIISLLSNTLYYNRYNDTVCLRMEK